MPCMSCMPGMSCIMPWMLFRSPPGTVAEKGVHLPDVVGAKVQTDLFHPRVRHPRKQVVAAVDPGRVEGTLHATRCRALVVRPVVGTYLCVSVFQYQ
jgi:hypothetical protein